MINSRWADRASEMIERGVPPTIAHELVQLIAQKAEAFARLLQQCLPLVAVPLAVPPPLTDEQRAAIDEAVSKIETIIASAGCDMLNKAVDFYLADILATELRYRVMLDATSPTRH